MKTARVYKCQLINNYKQYRK